MTVIQFDLWVELIALSKFEIIELLHRAELGQLKDKVVRLKPGTCFVANGILNSAIVSFLNLHGVRCFEG